MIHSPYIRKPASVQRVMGLVLLALMPGIVAYALKVSAGILINLALATLTAIAAEALMLALRKRPLTIALTDLSAIVTAWLDLPPEAIPAGGAAGSAAYLVGVFGPAFIELVLARLRTAKGGADDE